jgi:LuxR family maltose regulon positive regulatory protein
VVESYHGHPLDKGQAANKQPQVQSPLLDTLTNRELAILELLPERLYDKEIAQRLFISVATVKTHLKHIYQKLEVKNRREAVAKAGALGLRSPAQDGALAGKLAESAP